MTDLHGEWQLPTIATMDQQEAQMAGLGRQYAAMYAALIAGGVPRREAVQMLHRQQAAILQHALTAQQIAAHERHRG